MTPRNFSSRGLLAGFIGLVSAFAVGRIGRIHEQETVETVRRDLAAGL